MILAINYADDKFKKAQNFNSKMALKFGADRIKEYSDKDLSEQFKEKNKEIFRCVRGGGYWIWKPYIIKDALNRVKEGDYVIYTDAGSAFVNRIQYLIEAMNLENTDIMVFSIKHLEKCYTKRDAFILMDCDYPEIANTPQICGGYIVIRKTHYSYNFITEYLQYVQDSRIVADGENKMGKENYEGFVENRHDQSVLSLLCKKNGIKPFRDPSEWGVDKEGFPEDVLARSTYPQIIESHRNPDLHSVFQLQYKRWYRYLNLNWYKNSFKKLLRI